MCLDSLTHCVSALQLGLLLLWKFFEADGTAAQLADIQNNWRRRDATQFKQLRSNWGGLTAAAHRGDAQRLMEIMEQQQPEPEDLDEPADNSGQTALHRAVAGGHTQCAVLLLDGGAGASVKNHYGHSPMHLAARGGHAAILRELLRRGAPLTAGDQYGYAAIHVAAQHNQKEVREIKNDEFCI